MRHLILTLISFLLMEPVWNVDPNQNFFYFHQMHHPSVLTTAEEQASVAHLDMANLNQRLQEQIESNSRKTEIALAPTTAPNPKPAPALPQLPQLPLLQIPQHNRFQQLYGPSHVTTFFHNTLAGPLPFPFQPVTPYQNLLGGQPLHTVQNPTFLFQGPLPQLSPLIKVTPPPLTPTLSPALPPPSTPSVPVSSDSPPTPLPSLSIPPVSSLPAEPMAHLSTISDAQKIFEVRRRALTGYAYSIGSNDKIVATSSFTLGSSKHDPSFSRFKFLGQRPFENFENPYSSHLFQEKLRKEVSTTTSTAAPVTTSSAKPTTNATTEQPEPQESSPAPEQMQTEKHTELEVSDSTLEKESEVSPLPTTEKTENIKMAISNVEEENPSDVIESELVSVETMNVSTTVVPDVTDVTINGNGANNTEEDIPEALETKILTESSLKGARSIGNSLTESVIPIDEVIVPNSGRVRGVKIVVGTDDDAVRTNNDAVRGVISSGAQRSFPEQSAEKDQDATSAGKFSGEKAADEFTTQTAAVAETNTTEKPQSEVAVQVSDEPAGKSIAERVQPSVEISVPETVANSPNQLGELSKVASDDDIDSGGLPKGLKNDQYLQGILDKVSKGSQSLQSNFEGTGYEVEERSFNGTPTNVNSFETQPLDTTKLSLHHSTSPPVSETSSTLPPTVQTIVPTTQIIPRSTVKTSEQSISPLHRYGTFESRYLPLPETQALKLLQAARFRKIGMLKAAGNTTSTPEKKNLLGDMIGEKKVEPTKRPRVRVVVKTKQRNQRTKKIPPADVHELNRNN